MSLSSVRIADILRGPFVSDMLIPSDSRAARVSCCCAVMSDMDMPSSCMAFVACFGGPAKRRKPERNAVPAWLALMPLFAIKPASAAVSSIDAPNAFATGAAYFIVSPSISTLVFVRVTVTAKTSAMWPA